MEAVGPEVQRLLLLFHDLPHPLRGDTIIRSSPQHSIRPMTQHLSYALGLDRSALGVRWLIMVVILFGTIISAVGGTNSHGLASMATVLQVTRLSSDESHGHLHVNTGGESAMVSQSADTDHPHHGVDHSHDKAHALPVAWSSGAPQLPGWWGLVQPRIAVVQASRLERPPMG